MLKFTNRTICKTLITGLALTSASALQARDLTYAGWGGGLQDAQRSVYLDAYTAATGKSFKEDVYLGGWASFETMAASGETTWDVVNVEGSEALRGCDEGVFAPIDFDRLGVKADDFVPGTVSECAIGSYIWAFALAYNTDAVASAPKAMADIWDLETWPGKRAMRKGARFNLELALIADGVATANVYEILSTPEGVDRAFAMLDKIKSEVIWWEAPAQAIDLLASGNVSLAIAPNARISDAARSGRPFAMAFGPGMVGTDFWIIPRDTPNLDDAYEFLKIATTPSKQAEFSAAFAYAPTLIAAAADLSPEVAAELPIGPDLANALNVSSPESNTFWADHGDKIGERWTAWLAN